MVHGFYDESRQLLFATNIGLNELDVISGADLTVQSRVPVPQPLGIDQMADGKTLVIGTVAQELVTVDEDTLTVTQHPFTAAGSGGFTLFFPNVVALANGKVIAIGQEEGIDSSDIVDGGQYLYIWDSNANTFTQFEPTSNIAWETDSLARSADHKWAVFAGDQFYLYSSDSDSLTSAPFTTVNPPENEFGVRGYAINSDGSQIAVVSASQVTFLNNSLVALATVPIPGAFQVSRTAVQFSADSSKLYLQYDFPLEVEILDAIGYTTLGYLSATVVPDEDNLERMLATDSQGRGFFGINGGLRFVDLTQMPVSNGTQETMQVPNCPVLDDTLALNTSLLQTLFATFSGINMYVGQQAAPLSSNGSQILVPASSTVGPVDVVCIDSSGDTAVYADGVSYGVDPVGFSANLLPPSGNPNGYLYGFGFSGKNLEIPAVEIGSEAATNVTLIQDIDFGVLQGVAMQVPNGPAGQKVAVTASSSVGSGALASAASYYAAPTIIPASALLQLLYDTHRNLVYALKSNEIDVLDPQTLEWQTPISFPTTATGVYNIMALSPDGSRLVVEGLSGNSPQVVVLDPDGIAVPTVDTYSGASDITGSIAITASNQVILAGFEALEFDLSSLTFAPLNVNTGSLVRSTPDGTHIYGADLNNSGGTVYSIDPSTFAVQKESFGELFWGDLAVSQDGSQFAPVDIEVGAAGDAVGFFDSNLQYLNANVYPAFSPPDDQGATGATYSPAGEVLVVPLGDSLEFWDSNTDALRARLMTPEELQSLVYPEIGAAPVLTTDPTGQIIYAISASGVTVITLPEPMDQIPPMAWPELRTRAVSTALHTPGRARLAPLPQKRGK